MSGSDGDDRDRWRRALERICARRAAITVVFVLSGMMLLASLLLVFVADLSPASNVIAVVDVVITGTLVVASFGLLRLCARLRTGG